MYCDEERGRLNCKSEPVIVVFSASLAVTAICQDSLKVLTNDYVFVYIKQSVQALEGFPHAYAKPVLMIVDGIDDNLERFLCAVKEDPRFNTVPYILVRGASVPRLSEEICAPLESINILRTCSKLVKAVKKFMEKTLK